MYAMHAVSSPKICTWGLRIVVLTTLKFLPSTENENLSLLTETTGWLLGPHTILKVELVEIHARDEISQGLWLKRG